MRAIVTGCAGFLGSNLCEFLSEKGYEIIAIDNLSTGNKKNLKGIPLTFKKKDITKKIEIKGRIDEIYNLASPASPIAYQRLSLETIEVNSAGVKNMLSLARKKNALFLHTSTSEVYGDPLQHPQKESYYGNVNPIGPRACYDESKRFAETLITNHSQRYKTKTRIARIFNTYGPKMALDDGRIISNFCTQALQNKPITVYGKGKQTRSFCYASDMMQGLYSLMHSDYEKPVNLGNPKEFTVIETAQLIKKMACSESKIEFKKFPENDPLKRKPDISLAKKTLKWNPKIQLKKGLMQTIPWFEKELNKNTRR